jgi:hypothetical protein
VEKFTKTLGKNGRNKIKIDKHVVWKKMFLTLSRRYTPTPASGCSDSAEFTASLGWQAHFTLKIIVYIIV